MKNNSFLSLLKVQLLGFWGINKVFHTKGKKAKFIGIIAIGIITFIYLTGMISGISYLFINLGMHYELFSLAFFVTTLGIFFLTFFKSNILFKMEDYDILMSLPVKTYIIILTRVFTIYIFSLFLSILTMFPGIIMYVVIGNNSPKIYAIFAVIILFLPIIPIALSIALGGIVTYISTKFRFRNLVSIILGFATTFAFMGVIFSFNFSNNSGKLSIIKSLYYAIDRYYPVAGLFINSIVKFDAISFLFFILISLIIFLILLRALNYLFKRVNSSMNENSFKSKVNLNSLKISSPFGALYKNEIKRYFSIPLYVFNTAFGSLALIIFGLIMLFAPWQQFLGEAAINQSFTGDMIVNDKVTDLIANIPYILPFVMAFFVVVSPTTAASVSIEGKNLWIPTSLPVSYKDIYLSKIALNIIVCLPGLVISSVLAVYKLKIDSLHSALIFFVPLVYLIFGSILGLFFNLKNPVFDFKNEIEVIKRGMAVFYTSICGTISVIIPLALIFMLNSVNKNIIIFSYIVILVILSALMFYNVKKHPMQEDN